MDKYAKLIVFFMLISTFSSVSFSEVVFTFNSSDYYFVIGSDANIPVYVDNDLDEVVSGMLTYTITEKSSSKNSQSTSSSSQSVPFSIEKSSDNLAIGFNLGSSNAELTRTMSSYFTYQEPVSSNLVKIVFPSINVHFVKDKEEQQKQEEEQNSEEQKSESESEKTKTSEPQVLDEEMQKQIQNNQQSQDSNALKNQMKSEVESEEKKNSEIKEKVESDKNYQDAKKDLKDKGFVPRDEPEVDGEEFNQDFVNPSTGENANISADIVNNGSLENIKSEFESSELESEILSNPSKLNQELKKKLNELKKDGFNASPMIFSTKNNITSFSKELINTKNESVRFNGEINDSTVIKLEERSDKNKGLFFWFMLILIGVALLYYHHNYLRKSEMVIDTVVIQKTVDYRKEAVKMIHNAKNLFGKDNKDAYELLAYALRYYYSNKTGLKKEITNSVLKNKVSDKNISLILDASSIVEFAKGSSDKKTFDNYSSVALSFVKQ